MFVRDTEWNYSDVPHWGEFMEQQETVVDTGVDLDALKKDVKKLNSQATALKMNLHDLAEDLPIGWEQIPDLAEQTYQTYKNLMAARQRLADAGG
jgi:hypothetical protein